MTRSLPYTRMTLSLKASPTSHSCLPTGCKRSGGEWRLEKRLIRARLQFFPNLSHVRGIECGIEWGGRRSDCSWWSYKDGSCVKTVGMVSIAHLSL